MTDRFIENDYNKANRKGIRYSWPLKQSEVYKYDDLALSLVAQKWECIDLIETYKERLPDKLGLYMIVGSILVPAKKSTIVNLIDENLLSKLNCVLYVGQGKIKDRYSTHSSSPDTERMKNAIRIYKPKFYYIKTDQIQLDSEMNSLNIEDRTKVFESALIEFFGPPVNDQPGRNIIKAIDSNPNISHNKFKLYLRSYT